MARALHEASPEGQEPQEPMVGTVHQPVFSALTQGSSYLPLGRRLLSKISQKKNTTVVLSS